MVIHDSYSRVIGWLKILLPLTALAILSTTFLIARLVDPAQEFRELDADIAELAGQQVIRSPRYYGVTGSGVAIRLTAESALPDINDPESADWDRLRGRAVHAEIDIPGGGGIDVYAEDLKLDVRENLATLVGGVRIESSDDVVLFAEEMRLALDAAHISSDKLIRISAPIGQIAADSFRMTQKNENGPGYVLAFSGNVTMVFEPGK